MRIGRNTFRCRLIDKPRFSYKRMDIDDGIYRRCWFGWWLFVWVVDLRSREAIEQSRRTIEQMLERAIRRK